MTTTNPHPTITAPALPDHETARRALVPAASASVFVALVFEWFRSDSLGEAISMTALALVAAAVLFGVVVPRGLRHDSAGGRALALGLLAVLTFPAFWSQLPLLLGVSAALLGYAGKQAASRSGMSIAGLVLGVLAVIAYLAVYISDWITNPGASFLSGN